MIETAEPVDMDSEHYDVDAAAADLDLKLPFVPHMDDAESRAPVHEPFKGSYCRVPLRDVARIDYTGAQPVD